MIDSIEIRCPHCGETITLALDPSEGDHARVEDCAVCCSPMVVTVSGVTSGHPTVSVKRDND